MSNYNLQTPPPFNGYTDEPKLAQATSSVMRQVYVKMTLGMLVTAFISLFCVSTPSVIHFLVYNRWCFWGLFIAEIAIVFFLSARLTRMSSQAATGLFYLFAAINGAALSPIFLIYTGASITKTFFITAGTFGAMSVYGYFTTSDLTKWGTYLIYALFGLIIVSLVNIFTKSSTLDWIISGAGVLIFIGLTAWDTQTVKRMAAQAVPSQYGHLATIGALNLYLDFINLFLYLLRFFGSSRD